MELSVRDKRKIRYPQVHGKVRIMSLGDLPKELAEGNSPIPVYLNWGPHGYMGSPRDHR